jgi:DnaJ-class molecular chaperone
MARKRKSRGELKNYYLTLGVPQYASQKDIQIAFRKLAQKCHPDLNDEPDATEKFKELVEAYSALKEPGRRNDFDAQVISEYCMSFLGQFENGETPGKSLKKDFLRILRGAGFDGTDPAQKKPEPDFYRILQRLGLR